MTVLANRVKETTTTTGTGTYSLAGAVATFQTFATGVAAFNGGSSPWSDVLYLCVDATDVEIGTGTLTDASPDTITRADVDVIFSTNANSRVSWAAGTKTIACAPTAAEMQGKLKQTVVTTDGAVATTTTTLPYDDTIPQNTEGGEFMTVAITPGSTTSRLLITAVIGTRGIDGGTGSMALFQDSTAAALAASNVTDGSVLIHEMVSGTTSSTTFKIRAGQSAGGTFTFNGTSSARRYGGVSASSLTVTEYLS